MSDKTPAAQLGDKISRAGVVASTADRLPEMGRVAMEYAAAEVDAASARFVTSLDRLAVEMDKMMQVLREEQAKWSKK